MGKSNTLQSKPEGQDGRSHAQGGLDAHDNHVPLGGTGGKLITKPHVSR